METIMVSYRMNLPLLWLYLMASFSIIQLIINEMREPFQTDTRRRRDVSRLTGPITLCSFNDVPPLLNPRPTPPLPPPLDIPFIYC
jgi:hypothetical protein